MSFVEKHKAWLLPLLGVGVAGVIYLTLPSSAPTPPPAPAAPLPAASAAAAAPVALAAPAPLIAPAPAAPGGDLWSDLQALAKPPDALLQEETLRVRCRANLGSLLEAPAPVRLGRPGWVREAESGMAPPPSALAALPAPAPAVLPVVDFVLSGSRGASAWIQGHAYRAGEAIAGGPYAVTSIEWNRVGFIGPKGKRFFLFTNSSNTVLAKQPIAGPRPSSEAP